MVFLCRLMMCWMLLLPGWAQAAGDIPAPLEPWVDWVLHAHPDARCPRDGSSGVVADCAWINRLEVTVADGLDFRMDVRVYAETAVPLPGSRAFWPLDVREEGESLIVTGQSAPAVRLAPGSHRLTGHISWTRRPASVPIPAQSGLLSLTVDGQAVPLPLIRGNGLVLSRADTTQEVRTADTLKVDVFRLVEDTYPLELTTRVNLSVSGRPRQLSLGTALLPGFAITDFESDIPARLDARGDLQAQVTAGTHHVTIKARALDASVALSMQRRGEPWPEQEIWGFVPHRELRLVEPDGPAGVDLSQVDWPYGAAAQGFLMTPQATLVLNERQRGNAEPLPDDIHVSREMWMGFAGDGYIVRDALQADVRSARRLSATYPLGRIEIDGDLELVNTVDGGEPGVEVQRGNYVIGAVSAVPREGELSANGWRVDASSLDVTLHLPPGWRLLWASGVDEAPDAWLDRWSLWNVFVLVFAAVLAWRFLKPAFALLSLAGLLLLLPDSEGYAVAWLLAIGLVAVARRVTEGRAGRAALIVAWSWLALTIAGTLQIAVPALQQAFYPQLEDAAVEYAGESGVAYTQAFDDRVADVAAMSPAPMARGQMHEEIVVTAARKEAPKYRDDVRLQTGPGVPQWQWTSNRLTWGGPVSAEQTMSLTLASPIWVRIGNVLRALVSLLVVALLALALLRTARVTAGIPTLLRVLLPVVILGVSLPPSRAQAQDFPAPALLKELESRLLEIPRCFPECTSVEALIVRIDDQALTLALSVHAGTLAVMPIPVSGGWQPQSVTLDAAPAVVGRRNGALSLVVDKGVHRLVMTGGVRQGDRFDLALPLSPGRVEIVAASGWQVTGVVEGRATGGALSFQRERKADTHEAERALQPDPAPPFVEIRRDVSFGLEWTVTTTVVRNAPREGAFTVAVPLLPGESIVEGGVQAEEGVVTLVFAQRERSKSFTGRLPRLSPLTLRAGDVSGSRDWWALSASNLWHLQTAGINPVDDERTRGMVFRPRAGETLTVTATATTAVPGETLTVESVRHALTPGDRVTAHELSLTLRSSQGGTYGLSLPDGDNTLTDVTIDGNAASLPLKDNEVTLPVLPGETTYNLKWNATRPVGLRFDARSPVFAGPISNITTEVTFPASRWVLALGGPMMGPAMLFWGVLIVVLVLALGIARVPGIALSRTDAVLLGAGLSLCNLGATVLVAMWLILLAVRPRWLAGITTTAGRNLVQVVTAMVTVITVLVLIASVPSALLSSPDMHITGNGSDALFYRWYSDQAVQTAPAPWVLSVPMWVYRGAMLAWSLWLAFALIRWVRAAWDSYRQPAMWYSLDGNEAEAGREPNAGEPERQGE
ncbi:MAG: hypothetical protein R3E84_01715 [Pseudomonadales bacterium]